jgi:hypothetical protein
MSKTRGDECSAGPGTSFRKNRIASRKTIRLRGLRGGARRLQGRQRQGDGDVGAGGTIGLCAAEHRDPTLRRVKLLAASQTTFRLRLGLLLPQCRSL